MKTLNQIKTNIIRNTHSSTWTPMLLIFAFTLFLPACEEKDKDVLPVLNTIAAIDDDITSTTAILKGEVLDAGNMHIIEYGIEVSRSQLFTPSIKGSIYGAPSVGTFELQFTGLNPNVKYYFKAYALINTAEVYSENFESFTTKP